MTTTDLMNIISKSIENNDIEALHEATNEVMTWDFNDESTAALGLITNTILLIDKVGA